MKPQLRQLPVADVPDMDSWKVHQNAITFGSGVDETDEMFITCENVVDLCSERPRGQLGDLPEEPSDLIFPW